MATNVSNQNPVAQQVNETAHKEPNAETVNLVSVENNQVVTTSLRIADIFGKQHKDVLKAVKSLECSEDFHKRNFALMQKPIKIGNGAERKSPMYRITRDGFMFLVMGFTGKAAARWKEAYIKAFNEMEAKIRAARLGEQVKQAIKERDQKEYEEYLEQVRQEDEREWQHDKEVDEWHEKRKAEEAADTGRKPNPTDPTTESIVIWDRGHRVIISSTLAELSGRRHCDMLKSIRRTMTKCERPTRMFFKGQRAVYAKGTHYVRGSLIYYITAGGFQYLTLYTRSIPDDVAEMVRSAFNSPDGKAKKRRALPSKPTKRKPKTPTPPKPTAQTQSVATMPQTPADLMRRFVKAMGVMMGVDTNEMFNLTEKGE